MFMVFDVESIGLHGEGFAVAWVVVDRHGTTLAEGLHSCDPKYAQGNAEGREWVAQHVPDLPIDCNVPKAVRFAFWNEWRHWAQQGAVLVADCAWPVEARFLAAAVDDDPDRQWQGPYPLHDLSSIALAIGLDPLATNPRLSREQPAHHPLADARQSARLLLSMLPATKTA